MIPHRILFAAFVACMAWPHASLAQQVAFTTCKDGTQTTAGGNVGCANHGGVSIPAHVTAPPRDTAAEAARAPAPAVQPTAADKAKGDSTGTDLAGAVARCKDHTYSKTRQPSLTCVKHGGVATWLNPQK